MEKIKYLGLKEQPLSFRKRSKLSYKTNVKKKKDRLGFKLQFFFKIPRLANSSDHRVHSIQQIHRDVYPKISPYTPFFLPSTLGSNSNIQCERFKPV